MEVHSRPHSPGKKWTHYLWEFLMLFLAVFCGFLAENQREHMVDHQKEKQYMNTLLEDLKNDTSLLRVTREYWDTINISIDSLADAIRVPAAKTDLLKAYRFVNNAMDYFSFRYNDRTITQLKNAGGFRLIRNKTVANKIIAFDQFNNDAIINIRDQHNSLFLKMVELRNKALVQQIINEVFDLYGFKPPPRSNPWMDSLISSEKNPLPADVQTASMFEFKNALLGYRKDYSNMNYGYRNLKIQMDELIKLIKENYHLE